MSAEEVPPECLQYIISHVYNDNDTNTLFNLLQASKHVCAVTLPILYIDPFRRELHDNRPNSKTSLSVIKLVNLLLGCANPETVTETLRSTYSEDEDPNSQLVIVKPASGINYLQYLRYFHSLESNYRTTLIFQNNYIKDKILKTDFMDCLGLGPKYLEQELDIEYNPYDAGNTTYSRYLSVDLCVQLTWVLCSDFLENIRALVIPLSDIQRYIAVVDRLKNLTIVTFHLDRKLDYSPFYLRQYQEKNPKGLEAKQKEKVETLEAMIAFVKTHIIMFPGRLQSFSCPDNEIWASNIQSCPPSYQTLLQDLLPLLDKPRLIDEKNWFQFLMHIDNIDLSNVEAIELPVSDPVRYFPTSQTPSQFSFLPRCRNLRRLQMISLGPKFFEWAPKDKKQWENRSIGGSEHKPIPPIKLKYACLWSHWDPIKFEVNDILVGFSDTIETVIVRDNHRQNSYQFGEAPAPSYDDVSVRFHDLPFELPKLKRMIISLPRQHIFLPSYFVGLCPELEHLEVDDKISSYQSDNMRLKPNRRFLDSNQTPLSYKNIKLQGVSALIFHPKYLHRTPNLEFLSLIASSPIGYVPTAEEILQSEYSSPDEEALDLLTYFQGSTNLNENAQSEPETPLLLKRPYWSWDWELPKLRSLYLSGEFAWRFKFKMLARCPNMESLTLVSSSSTGNYLEASEDGFIGMHEDLPYYVYQNRIETQDFLSPSEMCKSPETSAIAEYIQVPKLTYLLLCGRWQFTNETLEVMLKDVIPNIITFNMIHCYGFNVQGWFNTVNQVSSLEKCSLSQALSEKWLKLLGVQPYVPSVSSHSQYTVIEEIKDGILQPKFILNPKYVDVDPKPIYEFRGSRYVKKGY
ncbi:hypothetical protein BGZ76_007738 [Entomortierella beljakovae]|nr:hypothetical protein BGZ76_007738 [Entomortierella beljakovae]